MAFGISRKELIEWKKEVEKGEKVVLLTHFWLDTRFPDSTSVTKAGCSDLEKLEDWGRQYGLSPKWIHHDPEHPHFDLFGEWQRRILVAEKEWSQIEKFNIDSG